LEVGPAPATLPVRARSTRGLGSRANTLLAVGSLPA